MYRPGDLVKVEFITSNPTTGAAVNADSTPTGTVNQNGTDDGAVTVTVTNIDTGRYKATFTIPTTYAALDELNLTIAATVSSVAGKAVIWHGRLFNDNLDDAGGLVRKGTAQGGTSNTIQLDSGAPASPNNIFNGLLVWITGGTGAGQVRTITAYNGTSKNAVVDRIWQTNPDSTSVFRLLAADNPALNGSLQPSVAVTTTVIRSGTAQSGSTGTTIKLDSGASATNNLYSGDLISITGGTGLGQTQTIVSYSGSTKVATIGGTWVTTPDATSTFSIYASTTPSQFSAQGVAAAGTASTITLDSAASPVSDIYVGSIITILAGTDAGDTAEITAYNGSTKVVTISGTFAVTPTTSSVYAIIPTASGTGTITGTQDVNVVQWNSQPVGDLSSLTDVANAVYTGTVAESYSTLSGTATLAQLLHEINQRLQNQAVSGTTITVKKRDTSTTALTLATNDPTNPTSSVRAS